MTERPDPRDLSDTIEHVQQTNDVVLVQPPDPEPSYYLWGRSDGMIFLMEWDECNYVGDDAVRRYKELVGHSELTWRDSSDPDVMNDTDSRAKAAGSDA
jgi:hypothetical protein